MRVTKDVLVRYRRHSLWTARLGSTFVSNMSNTCKDDLKLEALKATQRVRSRT